jgi:hypothetical protein
MAPVGQAVRQAVQVPQCSSTGASGGRGQVGVDVAEKTP